MEHRSHGPCPLPKVSYWLETEVVKAQDAKRPLGPFASNSDNLACQQLSGLPERIMVLPNFLEFTLQMKPERTLPSQA